MENQEITMNDIQRAVAKTSRDDFTEFAIKDYHSVRQVTSRTIARLRGKHVWTYDEYLEEVKQLCDVLYSEPKK